jgi:CheY-like chemotaxis protein
MTSGTSKKILYIEDNPANYRLVHRLLSQAGFEMHWAEEGTAGFELAMQLAPDLILMDVNLPGLSGFELTSKFRTHPELKATPIIAITAKTQKTDRETALVSGCSGFIPKPIDPFSFVTQVNAYLSGRQEKLEKSSEGRALRHFNDQLLERLELQLQEAQEANQKLMETQQVLERTNKSLTGLIALGQELMVEYDPWLLLRRILNALFLEVSFDSFAVYLQHPSGTYWEGLRLEENELVQAPDLPSANPFIQKLFEMETYVDWIHGPALLALPIWTDGYQLDIWQSHGQPCLFLNISRKNRHIRGFWAYDRKNAHPFIPMEFEMIRLYGRLTKVCLENTDMVSEMEEKTKALSASYENLERTYEELQKVKTELHEKERNAMLKDIFSKIGSHLREPILALNRNCQLVLQSVQAEDSATKQALLSISKFTNQVRGLFQVLLRRTMPETGNKPEWIDFESLLKDEMAFMEVEGQLGQENLHSEINLFGARVYGIYSDFSSLLRTMVLNSMPTPESQQLPRRLDAWREENNIFLQITDSAGKFHQQAIERAFEPFQGQREPIPGLRPPHPGLPSCLQILATYDGSLELENTEDGASQKARIALGV